VLFRSRRRHDVGIAALDGDGNVVEQHALPFSTRHQSRRRVERIGQRRNDVQCAAVESAIRVKYKGTKRR
jgi:hypothetical protein